MMSGAKEEMGEEESMTECGGGAWRVGNGRLRGGKERGNSGERRAFQAVQMKEGVWKTGTKSQTSFFTIGVFSQQA